MVGNKLSRILIVCLLIIPAPIYAEETTVTEGFDNQELNEDITLVYGSNDTAVSAETDCDNSQAPGSINIEDMDCHGGSPYFGSDRYQLGLRSSTDTLTIAFPNSETKPITEIGFITLAVDEANTGTVYYDNSTSATFNIITNDGNNPNQVTLTAPTGTTINEIQIAGASDNLGDWWLIDNIYYKFTAPTPTTTTTSSTTTTTTIPPPPPTTTTTTIPIVIVEIDGEELEYTQLEVDDGTVERDIERSNNLLEYGCELTNAQIERGDCDIETDKKEIYIEDTDLKDDVLIHSENTDEHTEEDILILDEEIIYIEELTDEEIELIEEQEEFLEEIGLIITDKDLEELSDEEILELEKDLEEYVEVVLEIEEYIDDLEDFDEVEIIIEEEIDLIDILVANDIFPPDPKDIEKDLEEIQDEFIEDEIEIEEEIFEDDIEILEDEELVEETVFEALDIFNTEDEKELSEEVIEEEVAELEEVIEIEEIFEEEATEIEKEEAIEEYVEELETEKVIEVIEEVNDIGVQNLSEATQETQAVVQAVVEEAIEEIEELTEEQVEVVAEVLQVEKEDVEIIAEAVKEDESVAQAVEEYVERAVENTNVENYTLADVVTEVQFEEFLENPLEVLTDINIQEIDISNIGSDMTNDQKEKAQEVVVPVILTRIASMAAFMFRRG